MALVDLGEANYVDARVGLNLVFVKMNESTRNKKDKRPKKGRSNNVPTIDLGSW